MPTNQLVRDAGALLHESASVAASAFAESVPLTIQDTTITIRQNLRTWVNVNPASASERGRDDEHNANECR